MYGMDIIIIIILALILLAQVNTNTLIRQKKENDERIIDRLDILLKNIKQNQSNKDL